MQSKRLKILLFIIGLFFMWNVYGQKVINYEAGMGSRKSDNNDVWILYQEVKAEHEGMWLYADSALLNTKRNDFTAYRHIKIIIDDTTTITGDSMYYDGQCRIVNIWADTVVFVDGKTVLKTPQLSYDRNSSRATYFWWGHTVNGIRTLDSRRGYYFSNTEDFEIYDEVVLQDTSSRLLTDTLYYNMNTDEARFVSPTTIYSDSTIIYSENGTYNTETRKSKSYKNSRVINGSKILTSDTLYYDDIARYGEAISNVSIEDTVNLVTCIGEYGETDQKNRYSYVTNDALVLQVDKKKKTDTMYVHGDTIYVYNNSDNEAELIRAYYKVKTYRNDYQGMSDSANYWIKDSLLVLYYSPVLWYDSMQCVADTIVATHGADGVKQVNMQQNCMLIEQVDDERYNQVKGRHINVYFDKGQASYADVLSNSQMCYYLTEEDTIHNTKSLIGVNAGVSTNMRVYFVKNEPNRVTAYGAPDMQTYPIGRLPEEYAKLKGFRWITDSRPRKWQDVFIW